VNPRLIGDEMVDWSDLDGTHGPGPVRGAALAALAAPAAGRTLVVGPHDPELIDAVPAGDLTLLVRGLTDAEALAARYGDRPGVTVCCGSPAKLAEEPAYDTVVALDGLGRLSSVEGAELSWGRALELLLAVLRPDGRLLLGVENFLGLHRLVAPAPEPSDSDWTPAAEYDPTRPAGLPRVLDRLDAAGLTVTRAYSAYPAPLAPRVLLGAEILADGGPRGAVEALLADACVPTDTVLADPRRLAVTAVRHGAAATLAPAWVLLAGRGSAGWPDVPEGLVAGDEIRRDETGRWLRAGTELPAGDTLEHQVIAACLRRDLPAVRDLLRTWQSGPAAEIPAGQIIVDPTGNLTTLPPAPQPDTPEPGTPQPNTTQPGTTQPGTTEPDTTEPGADQLGTTGPSTPQPDTAEPGTSRPATTQPDTTKPDADQLDTAEPGAGRPGTTEPGAARSGAARSGAARSGAARSGAALRDLAGTLLAGGISQPWPAPADADDLALMLATMAGRELDPAASPAAASPDAHAFRELAATRDRLARQLAEAQAKAEWYEETLTARDDALARARHTIEQLTARGPARLGTAFMAGARAARHAVRGLNRRVRQPL
jgi:hypothetical protein